MVETVICSYECHRCHEYSALLQNPVIMVTVLPVDARYVTGCIHGPVHTYPQVYLHGIKYSCEDLGVDESLAFLDGFVHEAIATGSRQYCPPVEDQQSGKWLYS